MTNSKIEVLMIVQNNFGLKFNPIETKIRIFRRFTPGTGNHIGKELKPELLPEEQ